jgi:hypothetical protein
VNVSTSRGAPCAARSFSGLSATRDSSFTLVLAALGIGAVGYHVLDGLPWLDAALNAAMILTGMGPVSPISSAAKVFATPPAPLSP